MPRNPRVVKAFKAMKAIGIHEEKTKPVLKRLLKLYDKNWELIEEENYRVLADAIFDTEDTLVPEDTRVCDEPQVDDEPERPLKRLRRGQNGQVYSVHNNTSNLKSDGIPLVTPKDEPEELQDQRGPISPRGHSKNTSKQPTSSVPLAVQGSSNPSDSSSPQMCHSYKGKEPLVPEAGKKDKRQMLERASPTLRIKEPIVDRGIVVLPKQKATDTLALIEPKPEPFTGDDMPQYEVPIAVIRPDPSNKNDSSVQSVSVGGPNGREPSASHLVTGENGGEALSSDGRNSCELAVIPEEPPSSLEIATSPLGEERLMTVTPPVDLLKKSAVHSTSNGSNDVHSSDDLVAPPTTKLPPPSSNGSEAFSNGCTEGAKEKVPKDPVSSSLVAVPDFQLAPEELRSLHYLNDISRGEEAVEIPWINEINNEFPPSFNYIPRNLVFQNAYAKFSLSKIGSDNCCPICIGDCLVSSTPCICASETGSEFAYTSEGLVKEDFLENCISMTRDPQRQCLSYCRHCPVERSKNDEMIELCKGHLKRKYIKECWSKCGCHKQCGNRLVQRGIRWKLQVFFTSEGKGWGLRTLEKLPKGAFVCEYVGEILTNIELHERNMQPARSSNTGTHTYPVLLDAYWFLKGSVKNEEALCLDSTFHGNIARFINHRCLDANLIEIPVKIDTRDHHYYHLAFFTTREVNTLEELTWDYGIDFDDNDHPVRAFRCQCGSKFCRNIKRPSRSKLALK